MEVMAGLDAPCTPAALFVLVADLSSYPQWLELVAEAEPDLASPAGLPVGLPAGLPAWRVELRASIGPLTRSKRLRMVRSVHDEDHHLVVFQRSEVDGRRHADWTLRAQVHEVIGGSRLEMVLRYSGALWTGGLLERALSEQIERGRQRLLELIETTR